MTLQMHTFFVQEVDGDMYYNGTPVPLSAYLPTIRGTDRKGHSSVVTFSDFFNWIHEDVLKEGVYMYGDKGVFTDCNALFMPWSVTNGVNSKRWHIMTIEERGNHLMPSWWPRNVATMHSPSSKYYQALVSIQLNDEWTKNVYCARWESFPDLTKDNTDSKED